MIIVYCVSLCNTSKNAHVDFFMIKKNVPFHCPTKEKEIKTVIHRSMYVHRLFICQSVFASKCDFVFLVVFCLVFYA